MKNLLIGMVISVLLVGCGSAEKKDSGSASESKHFFTEEQRKIADQIISIFENDTPVIQYGYAKKLGDGRGITAGRAGFTSATADMLEVIERYTKIAPNNTLAIYIPRLKELAIDFDKSTKGLEGLPRKWKKLAENKTLRKVQDEVVDDFYYNPATVHARRLGIVYPLTLLNLYDAVIQHGDGEDPDGLSAMIKRASSKVNGTPAEGTDEKQWLQAFMDTRRSVLLNPHNKETQQVWSESVGRLDALVKLYKSGNFTLAAPIKMNAWGQEYTLPVR